MELVSLKEAHTLFGVGRTRFMTWKKYDPAFPPVRGQKGRSFAFDLIELADYFVTQKKPNLDAPGFQLAAEIRLKASQSQPEA